MFPLKPLSREAIPGALAKAERYRLLHEPWQAESICRDICAADPENQDARIMLILALTDQFDQGIRAQDVLDLVPTLKGEYERAYYTGIIHERRAISLWRHGDFRSSHVIHPLLAEAMEWYEKAELLRPRGNDDALLRWNACSRFLRRIPQLMPALDREQPALQE
ncbi:MAG TPA: hypothetical protein VGS58_05445 [Candidatus Sulfopaludibacter sp.]|nr:hypothetical protein [Candidatus Sulfopaludibacter sp.]